MRWNENEVMALSQQVPDWEGKLHYIPPVKSSQSSIIKSGARSAAKLGNGLVKTIAGVGASTGQLGGHSSNSTYDSNRGNNARDRWFRIKANMLFYFRLTPEGCKPPIPGTEPLGMFVLEHFHVQKEGFEKRNVDGLGQNQFSLIFADEPDKLHFFIAESQQRATQWEIALKQASYQRMREKLLDLQIKVRTKTGTDPLQGSPLHRNQLFSSMLNPTSSFSGGSKQSNAQSTVNLEEAAFPNKGQTSPTRTAPPPPPRTKKSKAKHSKRFQSHIVNDWESISTVSVAEEATEDTFMAPINDRAATFRSHIPSSEVPVDNLIEF